MCRTPLESLESRRMLDATAALSRGVFQVKGTDADEAIVVQLSEDGSMVQATLDGAILGEAAIASVKAIAVGAGAGNDTVSILEGLTKKIAVSGGEGDDNLSAASPALLAGNAGNDTVSSSVVEDEDDADAFERRCRNVAAALSGGEGDDVLTALDANTAFTGGVGDDTITAGNGDNAVSGGDGADTVTVGSGRNIVDGGAGDDIITGGLDGVGNLKVNGGAGADTIMSFAAISYLLGGADDDTITGSAGDDTIYGGDGEDVLSGGDAGTDSVNDGSPGLLARRPGGGGHGLGSARGPAPMPARRH